MKEECIEELNQISNDIFALCVEIMPRNMQLAMKFDAINKRLKEITEKLQGDCDTKTNST